MCLCVHLSENILRLKSQNIKSTIFKHLKTKKLQQKHPKTKNSKCSKCHVRKPQIKNSENRQIVIIETY